MLRHLLIGLLLSACTQGVYAHAVVTEDSLTSTPIHVGQPAHVQLSFNSKIELGLSQVFLVSKGDKHQLLAIGPGLKQGQIIITIPALTTGDYALRLKVFAADGHLTEDIRHFSVSP